MSEFKKAIARLARLDDLAAKVKELSRQMEKRGD
jgi:hypothetical protein